MKPKTGKVWFVLCHILEQLWTVLWEKLVETVFPFLLIIGFPAAVFVFVITRFPEDAQMIIVVGLFSALFVMLIVRVIYRLRALYRRALWYWQRSHNDTKQKKG